MSHDTYYIDRDPRPKSHPCRYCARDVEVGRVCICAPVQLMSGVVMVRKVGFCPTLVRPYHATSQITTANGLLYRDGRIINLPEADDVALRHGHQCAEQFVRALEGKMV